MSRRCAVYLRVSTGKQSSDSQRVVLLDAAAAKGFTVVKVYEDAGVSGSKGRDERPAFDEMCKDMVRGRFDMVMVYDVSRLGRSLQHLVTFMAEIQSSNVDLFIHQSGLDTSTPSGRMMFGMVSVFAEFEREMIAERVKAGMLAAKQRGAAIGRPGLDSDLVSRIQTLRAQGASYGEISKICEIPRSTVAKYCRRL
jgi:DNA invertase Pin-like site-specific DNA recombinase